jgi:hypothetical protein
LTLQFLIAMIASAINERTKRKLFGTVRYMVFFVIQLKTRAVEVAGIRVDPDGEWMK